MQGKRIAPPDDKNKQGNLPRFNVNATPDQSAAAQKAARSARRKKIAYRSAVAVLAVLLALLIGVAAWWKVFIQKPTIPDDKANPGTVTDIAAPVRAPGERKDDFFTFLILGRDTGGGGNTDTILLAAYDAPNQKLNVMSIPRDTMVNVPWEIKKINSVYNYYGAGDTGIEALGKEVAQLVGFVPDYQVVLEWKAVGELVDALGGVRFDVPQNMNYRDPTQNLTINVKKGEQLLNGDLAMQVVRFRSYPDGDLGRIKVQQAFLTEAIKACLKLENMTKANALITVFTENVTTNLQINELAWLADKAIFGGLTMENVNFVTMPNTGANVWSNTYQNYQSYVVPIESELVELVNRSFNPYLDDLDTHELDIMSVKDGRISSSTGKVEDPNANSGRNVTSSNTSETKPTNNNSESDNPPAGNESTNNGSTNNSGTNNNASGSNSGTNTQTPPVEEQPTPPPTDPEPTPEPPPVDPEPTPPPTSEGGVQEAPAA